jgi:hypothetical protein
MVPVTGFHSVIESPDSVSRVIPPTIRIRHTIAATANSQRASASGAAGGGAAAVAGSFMRPPCGGAGGFSSGLDMTEGAGGLIHVTLSHNT